MATRSFLCLLQDASGEREMEMEAGVSYARPAGVEHNLVNANAYEFRFVEIELKQGRLGRSAPGALTPRRA